jgi:hypothetical protein
VETINTGLKETAAVKNAGNSAQNAVKWLVDNHEKWLLFFDNADDPSINLNAFLPQCNHGNIVITSRNPELCVYAGVHSPVSDMEETDAVALLLKSAAQEPSSVHEKVAAKIVKVSGRSFMYLLDWNQYFPGTVLPSSCHCPSWSIHITIWGPGQLFGSLYAESGPTAQ